jgi:hypothetical protein
MKLRLLIVNSMLFLTIGYAQTTPKKNKIEFSTGFNKGYLKNLEFAPVAMYEYEGLVYKLNYERTSKKQNLFEVEFDYLKTNLKTDVLYNLNADYSKMGMGFSYLKQVYNKNGFAMHLGLQSQTNLSTYFKKNIFNSNNYFTFHQEFGIASRFGYHLNEKQYLSSKLTIPVVLLRLTDAAAKFYTLDKYQSVFWDLEYGYELSNHFDVKVTYDFKYSRLQVPSAYQELQHQLNIGINYKF